MEKYCALFLKVSFLTWFKVLQNIVHKIILQTFVIYDDRGLKTQHTMMRIMPWGRDGNSLEDRLRKVERL